MCYAQGHDEFYDILLKRSNWFGFNQRFQNRQLVICDSVITEVLQLLCSTFRHAVPKQSSLFKVLIGLSHGMGESGTNFSV